MIVALAGGVGGAKLAHGLAMAAPPAELTVVVNTADDFDLFGLRICPDLDTVMYTLAGIANPATGWGIAGDTRTVLDAIERYQGESWFLLGDRDIATHILRTERLGAGLPLSNHYRPAADRAWHPIAPSADDRQSGCDHRRNAGGPARLPGLFRSPPAAG
jgi:LPPG:FO 2-phospho-L-lactate transferase